MEERIAVYLELDRLLGELAERCKDSESVKRFEALDDLMPRVQKFLYPEASP